MRWLWLLGMMGSGIAQASVTHHIYWNTTNPAFETFEGAIDSPGFYEVAASAHDSLQFICPKKKSREFTIVYKVNIDEFAHCYISTSAERVGACDGHTNSFIVPLRKGSEYAYYITASTGAVRGLHNKRLGLCLEKNMRVRVSLELGQTKPLHNVLHELELESMGLLDSRLYLIEENGEVHWKKNVHPSISNDLNKKIKVSVKYDKNREMEPIPISNEFIIEKLEEMNQPEESYIFSRKESSDLGKASNAWLLSSLLFLFMLLL